jgi:transcriptional regulator with PAS, ATPase and Fis domain
MVRTLEAWHDSDRLLRLAAQTFFDQLSEMCEGILVVDKAARIVWIDDRWQRNIQSLGFNDPNEIIGRPVEEIVPNTLMRHVVETGKPILLDILENKAGTYIVSRFPVHDEAGAVIGAVGLILYDRIESLKPLMGKLSRLQTELAQAQSELARQRRTRYTFSNFVGNSERALDVKSRARRAAVLNTTVLLLGETGTGKELLAQAIHSASPRARHPFIAVNVAAIPDTLLEAEFFGVAPAPTPAPTSAGATASSSWPMAAPCFSTRSATCRSRCRPSCCARCRSASSSRSGRTPSCASMRA